MKPHVLGAVFARGGSKGLLRKNLRLLAGKPLVGYAIEAARACELIDRVIVSTDDDEIAAVARRFGAEVPFMRPAELATDDAPEWLAWQHALRLMRTDRPIDVFACIPPTAPLRTVKDVTACIRTLLDSDADIVITVTPAQRNPYFNMVALDEHGYARLAVPPADGRVYRRQAAPQVFDITTVAYAARPEFILRANGIFDGRVRSVEVPAERAIDVDTEMDLRFAELVLAQSSRAQQAARQPAGAGGQEAGVAVMRSLKELMDLHGRTAVITGGAGRIGSVMAESLAELGAAIAVLDVAEGACKEVATRIRETYHVETLPLVIDLANEDTVRSVPAAVANRFGRLDVLVNCAAMAGAAQLEGWATGFLQQRSGAWRQALEINLTAPFVLTQACAPALAASGHGSVINVGSIYGIVGADMRLYEGTGMGNPAAYAASKGGLLQLTRWLATALAPKVRVNAISPGGVWRGQPQAFHDRYVARTPLGRMASEEDLKGAVAYLAGDLSSYVTGHNLVVDGGWTVW